MEREDELVMKLEVLCCNLLQYERTLDDFASNNFKEIKYSSRLNLLLKNTLDTQHKLQYERAERYLIRLLTTFFEEDAIEYYEGRREADCTTLAQAAKAGALDFLKWAKLNGHAKDFDSLVMGYAITYNQKHVVAWLESQTDLPKINEIIKEKERLLCMK